MHKSIRYTKKIIFIKQIVRVALTIFLFSVFSQTFAFSYYCDLDNNGKVDGVADFGANGVWVYYNNTTWTKIHSWNVEGFSCTDLDNNGQDDFIGDFGLNGLWVYYNNTTWTKLGAWNVEGFSFADLDNNGQDDFIGDYGANGVMVYYNNTTWTKISSWNVESFKCADLDNNGHVDYIGDYGANGPWVYYNNTTWTNLGSWNVESFQCADLDNNGHVDYIGDYGANGVVVYYNNTTWTKIHSWNVESFQCADLDNNGQNDFIGDFGANGLWVYFNNATWTKIGGWNVENFLVVDLDNNGQVDFVGDYGSNDIWAYYNNTTWTKIGSGNAEKIWSADIDSNGSIDIVADFGASGLYVYYNNNSIWSRIHTGNIEKILFIDDTRFPDIPRLTDPGVSSFNGTFTISWNDTRAFIYELQQASDEAFTAITNTFWPSGTFEDLDNIKQPTSDYYYYYRVRSWNALPADGGNASSFSNTVVIGVDYERDIDVLAFPDAGIFTEVGGAPGTSLSWVVDSGASSYSDPVAKLDYDLTTQFFAGLYLKDASGVDISSMNTLNIRIRGDATEGYPIRMVIELKEAGEIQGVLLVSALAATYQDLTFPFYSESNTIDEVIIYVEDDTDGNGKGALYIDEFFFSAQPFTPDIEPAVAEDAASSLTDQELLDTVQAHTAHFFYDTIIGAGYVKDTSETTYSSIAATGFGLAALPILAARYNTTSNWQQVTPAMAETRAEALLDALLLIQSNQGANPAEYGVNGFFYHFIDNDGKRAEGCEVSVIDTALLVVGALTAGEYFGGTVKTKADQLYAAIDWTIFIDGGSYQYHMGWKPESSLGFTTPKNGGFISSGTFNKPTDEVLLIALLALGNHIDNTTVRKSYFSYPRASKTYTALSGADAGTEYQIVNSYFGSLFTYLYAHCFFDFETLGVDQTYFASDAPYPVSIDWWDNSVQAFKANRQFCIDQEANYPFSYSKDSWGISAVQRPDGRYEGRYGAVPFDNGPGHDGVVALYGAMSSMPFFRESALESLSDNEGFQSLRSLYDTYRTNIYGSYGFYDSFDYKGNFSTVYLGLDQGPIVLMIENYRSNLIWTTLEQNEKISDVLDLVFADDFGLIDIQIKNIADNSLANDLSFNGTAGVTTVASSEQYTEISVTFNNPTGKLIVYTNNKNSTIPYTGGGDAAGLVGVTDTTQVAPVQWVVFDALEVGGYLFTGSAVTEGKMQDYLNVDFVAEGMLEKRTIMDGNGNLAPYPTTDRTTASSTVYVYYGCDFTDRESQNYTTDTLTIEIFQE
ncbi:MAG: hypothetical protein KKH94_09055 [Candidatus Omnitrophica bacterium]|nr:hypothetical protein [Candidatus Omnitrophota bacterium]